MLIGIVIGNVKVVAISAIITGVGILLETRAGK